MPKLFHTIRNILSIEELRVRILNTIGFLQLFPMGSYVVLPGIDPTKLAGEAKGIFGLLDTFLGGAFSNASVLGLGVMPYISASIAIQLLIIAVPYFQRLQKEGQKNSESNYQSAHHFYCHDSGSGLPLCSSF